MDTISTIVGPSITLAHPLVGSSLASDWARFSKSNRLSDNIPLRQGDYWVAYVLVIPVWIVVRDDHVSIVCLPIYHFLLLRMS